VTDRNNIIDPWSTGFVDDLVREFFGDVTRLRLTRASFRNDPRRLGVYLDMPSPAAMRDPLWRVRAVPRDLIDRRVEITGPAVDPKMAITALNSGAQGYMVDAEDSMSPTWSNVLGTQATLVGIVRRSLKVPEGGSKYFLSDRLPTLHFRPRGMHLDEANWVVDGNLAPAALVDIGLFMWLNAREIMVRGSAPYVYLPKMETEMDAWLWNRIFAWIEERLGLQIGSIRCTVLVETVPAVLRLEEIIWTLRDRLTGLNVGRWDYVLSLIRSMHLDGGYVLPDRSAVTMESPAMVEYARWVVRVAHRRGAYAIGGMAADVPSRKDPVGSDVAMRSVVLDKQREALLGHDGTWVAHPDLVGPAMSAFDDVLRGQVEQRWNLPPGDRLDFSILTTPPVGPRTMDGLRNAVATTLVYMDAWLSGNGCVAMGGKMEDAATAEISRALVWQWISRGASLDDGTMVTATLVDGVIRGEVAALVEAGAEPRREVVELLSQSIYVPRLPDHILTAGYEVLMGTRK